MKRFFYLVLCGFVLGISAFAPGFSGSVMAITMGIYGTLVKIMSNPLKELKRNINFFIPIAVGVVVSAVLFVLTFQFLFQSYIRATFMLFVGLIAGNFPVITREVRKHTFKKQYLLGGAVAFAIALGLSLAGIAANHMEDGGQHVAFVELAISGFVAGGITLVPGMSISAILIMLGVYGQLIMMAESLLRMNLTYVLPLLGVLLCAVAGLVLTSRGIKKIFDQYPGFANSCVLGFMGGTLIGIFVESFYLPDPNFTWPLGIAMLAAGLGLSIVFVILGKTMSRKTDG